MIMMSSSHDDERCQKAEGQLEIEQPQRLDFKVRALLCLFMKDSRKKGNESSSSFYLEPTSKPSIHMWPSQSVELELSVASQEPGSC